MPGILIIEDEAKTAKAIARGLETEGHRTRGSPDDDEGRALGFSRIDYIILDWMLPSPIASDPARLRANGRKVPVLLLTARDAVADKSGTGFGSRRLPDQTIRLPELLARIRVLLVDPASANQIRIADLHLDGEPPSPTRRPTHRALTPRVRFAGVPRAARDNSKPPDARQRCGGSCGEQRLDNVIDVHIAHLRRKIDEDTRSAPHTCAVSASY
jgi:DNA-binding response OmpR family regulator